MTGADGAAGVERVPEGWWRKHANQLDRVAALAAVAISLFSFTQSKSTAEEANAIARQALALQASQEQVSGPLLRAEDMQVRLYRYPAEDAGEDAEGEWTDVASPGSVSVADVTSQEVWLSFTLRNRGLSDVTVEPRDALRLQVDADGNAYPHPDPQCVATDGGVIEACDKQLVIKAGTSQIIYLLLDSLQPQLTCQKWLTRQGVVLQVTYAGVRTQSYPHPVVLPYTRDECDTKSS